MSVLQFDCRFHYPAGFRLDFAFEMQSGVAALVGPSGCGKTTVLNLIAGLLTPDAGTVRLQEQQLFDSKSAVNLRPESRGIGYVFQDYQLFPHLTVEQNLRYGKQRSRDFKIPLDRTIEILELRDLFGRMPASLSGGQKQRVALGRALLRGPKLLLLDEPLTALDAALRQAVAEHLSRAIEEFQIPTLLVSHDQESIGWLAHSTISMVSPPAASVSV
ncbi:MAG TPA: ATP-binding cassette domain-containing protein [Pirellulales bacterium]|jgi:molybdate transport system ATP-binding protein